MPASEKQASQRGPWQIKTKEGIYYQPESLSILYQWVFDNRLCADDFIFSAKVSDWIPIVNMLELRGCFWQLLTGENVIYGPVSIGELRQLYVNKQINPADKVTISGKENWIRIEEVEILHDWLQAQEVPAIDYIQFVSMLEGELGRGKGTVKEEKAIKKLRELEQQNKEDIGRIKGLGEELAIKSKEIEGLIAGKDEINTGFQSIQEELRTLQAALQEKIILVEELNKQIAQAEVANTLKDDQINQLQSSIASLQEELKDVRSENSRLQQSLPDALRGLEAKIGELDSKNRDLAREINGLQGLVFEKEKEISFYKDEIANIQSNARTGEEELYNLQRLISEKESELSGKEKAIEEITNNAGELGSFVQAKEEEITNLREAVSGREAEIAGYRDTIVRLQGELAERDRGLVEASTLEMHIGELDDEIGRYRQEIGLKEDTINELNDEIGRYRQEIGLKEDTINELKHTLEDLQQEYKTKVKELEDAVLVQRAQYQNELVEKTRIWEEALRVEKGKWEDIRQDLEGDIAQRDAQIEAQRLEIEKLQEALISLDRQWKERIRVAKEDGELAYRNLERQGEDLRAELTQKIDGLTAERVILQKRFIDLEARFRELTQRREVLEKELLDRERFIELIKTEAIEKEESHVRELSDVQGRLYQINAEIENLQKKREELAAQLQNELDIQEGLRKDISLVNEELNNTRQLVKELQREKEEAQEIKLRLERELEEANRNLEHSHEENRSLQKQFYLEKQKITKEYNETISKQEKLKKREQLEREIQDRTRMKEELERLYNLIKENFEGLQHGAQEIQSSLQGLGDDIDNKRLSLKYLTETGKREEKKGQFPRVESAEETDTTS